EPEILLVDEVLAVGDVEFQKKCLGKMSEIADEGRTVIFVSHNMAAVRSLCSRCLLLENGTVKADGVAEDILDKYLSTASFCKFEASKRPHVDVPMFFLKASFEKSADTPFDLSENIQVFITYEVRRQIKNVHVIAFFDAVDGNRVLGTSDVDRNPEHFLSRKPGVYRESFSVPAGLLAEGWYTISLSFGSPGRTPADQVTDALTFEVINQSSPRLKSYSHKRPGVIGVDIAWEPAERLGEAS
ncbi:MAG: ABC transporter ATP-binding protein, partial [Deltaproteobacteria bacterium]|nr:ABC transporter ATP-binding protein [Deltaproteobacteria bacterium]